MSQMSTGKRVVPPSMNIYTVLVLVAFLALGLAIGVVIKFSGDLSGQKNPWHVEPPTAEQKSVQPAA